MARHVLVRVAENPKALTETLGAKDQSELFWGQTCTLLHRLLGIACSIRRSNGNAAACELPVAPQLLQLYLKRPFCAVHHADAVAAHAVRARDARGERRRQALRPDDVRRVELVLARELFAPARANESGPRQAQRVPGARWQAKGVLVHVVGNDAVRLYVECVSPTVALHKHFYTCKQQSEHALP